MCHTLRDIQTWDKYLRTCTCRIELGAVPNDRPGVQTEMGVLLVFGSRQRGVVDAMSRTEDTFIASFP
jgi:hypothetical protein